MMKKTKKRRRNPGSHIGDALVDRLMSAISPDLAEAYHNLEARMMEAQLQTPGVFHAPRTLRVFNHFDQL